MTSLLASLETYLQQKHPRFITGFREARAIDPRRFEALAEMFLGWAAEILGEETIPTIVEGFVKFTSDVNWAQARYEAEGHYAKRSFKEVYDTHYSCKPVMRSYLWGVYLANFLWPHHLELSLFYHDRFLRRIAAARDLVEIAPGCGGWGIWALQQIPSACLRGFDISEASVEIARALGRAAGVSQQCRYELRDALDLGQLEEDCADAVICCFLVEHLEEPAKVFAVVKHLLRPHGYACVTGALTAAQVDHIYEFRRESELVRMAEAQGLRAVETASFNPPRVLQDGRRIPRSMALILRHDGEP